MKALSLLWALAVGAASVIWQVLTYYFRFGKFNTNSPFSDYVWFFIAGALGGLILVMFMNRQPGARGRWTVLIAFLLITPVAMIFMVGGGLLGFMGTLFFPQVPWLIFTWIGSIVGKFLSRG